MKIKTDELEVLVADFFDIRTKLIIPNVSWGFGLRHEADLIIVTRSKCLYEVELKISKADLKADLKKKHKHKDPKNRIKRLYFAMPEYVYEESLVPDDAGVLIAQWVDEYYNWNGKKTAGSWQLRVERLPKDKKVKPLLDKDYLKLLELCAMRIWTIKKRLLRIKK